ncbi:hypothetical protein [Ideonella alba]|uniref:Uncharacterized protein n=1 Tax=Ideonella alba TaxID=2824118 RepID=A0A940YJ94_9BURK|nr:hypothetical protein [Ideonella alba]MBQ0933605.1 hypothetical protein [Ideonella alba]
MAISFPSHQPAAKHIGDGLLQTFPNHKGTKIMNKTAKPKQVEVKSEADFSAKVKVDGNFQMKLKSLTIAAALGAVVYSASLP